MQGRGYREGMGGEKFIVGRDVWEYGEGYKEGGAGRGRGQKPRHQYGLDRIISVTVGTEYSSWI